MPAQALYQITGYDKYSNKILTTEHWSEASKDIELRIWARRILNPQDSACYVKVYDTVEMTTTLHARRGNVDAPRISSIVF